MLAPLIRISYSATPIIIRVTPLMHFAEPGEHFNINLTIMESVDVYAWQVNMTFDSAILRVVNATLPPDHFLEGRPSGTTGLQILKEDDYVLLGTTILGDYLGMHGSGTLVTVEFEVLSAGESVLKIDLSQPYRTYLLDSELRPTFPGPDLKTEDGYISNIDRPPTASFTYSPSSPALNEQVTFDASASSDPDGQIVRYEWDFGDGTNTTETDPTANHTYTTAKTYMVTLTVIDNATATQKMKDTFNTTTTPHLWYELYSSYSKEVKFKVDHDVAVISVTASPGAVKIGKPVTISVTVENLGKETETFSVIAYYDSTTAASTTVENLAPEGKETLELIWNTTDVAPEIYVIRAEANLEGDEDLSNNLYQDGTVRVDPSETPFPIEYIAIGVVGVGAVIGIGVFLFLRSRRTPAT